MNINFHSTSKPLYALSVKPTIENLENEIYFSKEVEKKEDTTLTKQNPNIWEKLSNKYDVTNASFDDLNEISTTLFEAGEISLKEHAILIFDFDKATESLRREVPGVSPNFTMYATQSNTSGNRNWIEEFQARADKDFKHNNLIGSQMNLKLMKILQKLER